MNEIVLKRANVVKRVDSEDKAKALEAQGFVRTDGKTAKAPAAKDNTDKLQKELADTKTQLQEAVEKAEASEKELADAKEQLQEAEKKIQTLEADLKGTKEQLEAAVKQNKAANKK